MVQACVKMKPGPSIVLFCFKSCVKMKTIPSLVFVLSHARKYVRMQPSILLSLFRTRKGYTKKEPTGVPFKLFSDSLNMKRLLSDLVIFTLIKVFEENIC
jgi:hypothetical protein